MFNIQKVALHLHLNEGAWSHNKFKKYKLIFKEILDFLRNKGYTEVFAIIPVENIKAQKFDALVGFKEFDRKQGYVLMKREV
jgi:hypothetical protein